MQSNANPQPSSPIVNELLWVKDELLDHHPLTVTAKLYSGDAVSQHLQLNCIVIATKLFCDDAVRAKLYCEDAL